VMFPPRYYVALSQSALMARQIIGPDTNPTVPVEEVDGEILTRTPLSPTDTDYVVVYSGTEYPFYVESEVESEQYFGDLDMVAPVIELTGYVMPKMDMVGSLLLRHKDNPDFKLALRVYKPEYARDGLVTVYGYGSMQLLKPLRPNVFPSGS